MQVNLSVLDSINGLALSKLIREMQESPDEKIQELSQDKNLYCIFGVVASITNNKDTKEKTLKIVHYDSKNDKWSKGDKGVYISVPSAGDNNFSTDIRDIFIGDVVTVVLAPKYKYDKVSKELHCSCVELREGTDWDSECEKRVYSITGRADVYKESQEAFDKENKKREWQGRIDKLPWIIGIVIAIGISLYLNSNSSEKTDVQSLIESRETYLIADSHVRYLSEEEVNNMSLEDRDMACYEILARHGADFSDVGDNGAIQDYFEDQEWYDAKINFADFDYTVLNVYEAANLAMLIDYDSMKETADSKDSIQSTGSDFDIQPGHYEGYTNGNLMEAVIELSPKELSNGQYDVYGSFVMISEYDVVEVLVVKDINGNYLLATYDFTIQGELEILSEDTFKVIAEDQSIIFEKSRDTDVDNNSLHMEPEGGEINSWLGTYQDDSGQRIDVLSVDEYGVMLKYTGYSEEGQYTVEEYLPYINEEKTQAIYRYMYNGQVVQETVYTILEDSILVEVLPGGGWADGIYERTIDESLSQITSANEIVPGYYIEPNNEIRLSISMYSSPEDEIIGSIEYDYGFGYDSYMILDNGSDIYILSDSFANVCGTIWVIDGETIGMEIFGEFKEFTCVEVYSS